MDELNKLPGGGGDCDWNIMKNKPFGTEIKQAVALDIESKRVNDQGFVVLESISIFAGEQYAVHFNGNDFNCTAISMEIDPTNGIYATVLGNVGAMMGGEGTGETFLLMVAMGTTQIMPLDGSNWVNKMTITGLTEVVTRIEAKYLPEGDVPVHYVDFKAEVFSNDNVSYSCNMTFHEVSMLYGAGAYLVARVQTDSASVFYNLEKIDGEFIDFVRVYWSGNDVVCSRISLDDLNHVTVSNNGVIA